MLIGYARTSTFDQKAGLEGQIDQLLAMGCNKVFSEQVPASSDGGPSPGNRATSGGVSFSDRMGRYGRA